LVEMLDHEGLPHIINETHVIVSPDLEGCMRYIM